MKKIPASRRLRKLSSFTLVELLVVMGIIAILASVLLEVGITVLNSAKRAKGANLANQIQTAALGYYTEYSVYPVASGVTTDAGAFIGDTSTSQTAWGNLIDALCGNVKPSTGAAATQTSVVNTRGIAFLSLKGSDVDSGDAPKNPMSTGTEIYFNIAMDADYDGLLSTASPSSLTSMPNFAAATQSTLSLTGGHSSAGVAVWANCTGSTAITNSNFWVHTY